MRLEKRPYPNRISYFRPIDTILQLNPMFRRFFTLLLLLFPALGFAQQWKKQRKEIVVGIGASNFLGDLGGADQIGTNFYNDLEFSQTNILVNAGYRYRFTPTISFKGGVFFSRISGSDLLTKEPARNNRKLEFRSNILEVSGQFEYALIEEHIKGRYIRGKTRFPVNIYVFAGLGFTYFNPKSRINFEGPWISLQPLGTEGQGLPGQKSKYTRVTIVIPVGIGFKYPITNQWHVGLEYSMRATFTDYMDDVSGYYFDRNAIGAAYGPNARYFADPASYAYPNLPYDPKGWTAPGQNRGNSSRNDSYIFVSASVSYKLIRGTTRSRVKF